MMRETPESFIRADARQQDQIEIRIAFLTEELESLAKKMQQESKPSRLRMMAEQKQQLELELRWAHFQKKHLTEYRGEM